MRAFKAREIPIALRSGLLAAVVPLLVRSLPLPRVLSMVRPKHALCESSFKPDELARFARAVVRYAPRFGVGECLVRSVVLYNLLRASAYEPVLVVGGRLCDGEFDCHCWIEIDGKSLCESNDPRQSFKLFYTFI